MLSQFRLKARSLSLPRESSSLYLLLLSILFGLNAAGAFIYLQNALLNRTTAVELPSSSSFHIGMEDPDFECAAYYAQQAAANGVTLYTIGIGAGVNSDLLVELATGIDPRSGGIPVPMFAGASGQYFPATKPTGLDAIFGTISLQTSCLPPSYLPIILKNS